MGRARAICGGSLVTAATLVALLAPGVQSRADDSSDSVSFIYPVDDEPSLFSVGKCPETGETGFRGKCRTKHEGIDIFARRGTRVFAAADGVVLRSRDARVPGPGRYVLLDHGAGIYSWYLHLHERHVKVGDRVKAGQVIGLLGRNGYSKGPSHLHFEIGVGVEVRGRPEGYVLYVDEKPGSSDVAMLDPVPYLLEGRKLRRPASLPTPDALLAADAAGAATVTRPVAFDRVKAPRNPEAVGVELRHVPPADISTLLVRGEDVYAGTTGGGVVHWDLGKKTVARIAGPEGLANPHVTGLAWERGLVAGTYNGASFPSSDGPWLRPAHWFGLWNDNRVESVSFVAGWLWFGTLSGLRARRGSYGFWRSFTRVGRVTVDRVHAVADAGDVTWLAGRGRVFRVDRHFGIKDGVGPDPARPSLWTGWVHGRLWVATAGGLWRRSGETWARAAEVPTPVTAVVQEGEDSLLVASARTLRRCTVGAESRLVCAEVLVAPEPIGALVVREDGTVVAGAGRAALILEPGATGPPLALPLPATPLDGRPYVVAEAEDGLWVATRWSLFRLPLEDSGGAAVGGRHALPMPLSGGIIRELLLADGVVWVAGEGGVARLDLAAGTWTVITAAGATRALYRDPADGSMLLGGARGVFRVPGGGRDAVRAAGTPEVAVRDILDYAGTRYYATDAGLWRDGGVEADIGCGLDLRSLATVGGRLFVGSFDWGLCKLDRPDDKVHRAKLRGEELGGYDMWRMVVARDGKLWVSVRESWAAVIDPKRIYVERLDYRHGMNALHVRDLAPLSDGRVALATAGGLFLAKR